MSHTVAMDTEEIRLSLPRGLVQRARVIVHDSFAQSSGAVNATGDEALAFVVALGALVEESVGMTAFKGGIE